MWGNLVTWSSKKQGVVATCIAEAKFNTMVQEICESLWIPSNSQQAKGDMTVEVPLKLHCENKATISIAHNPVQHDRTEYIEIDCPFI